MENAAVILNPAAGQDRLAQSMDAILDTLQEAFSEVSIYRTEKQGDGARYVQQLEDEADVIIAAGGDGTVHEVAGAICSLENRPIFAVIPGGTCNDFSRAIGINQNPIRAAQQIAEKAFRTIEVGKANDHYFLNFWGIGLITQVSSSINPDTKETFGRLAYYISTAQNLSDALPFRVKVESDDRSFDGEAVMVLVGNGPFTGGIRAFFPRMDMSDGRLDVLIIKETSFRTLWSILRSKVIDTFTDEDEDIIHFRTKQLTISAEPEQDIDCDGERYGQTPATVSVLPEHLRVIVGY